MVGLVAFKINQRNWMSEFTERDFIEKEPIKKNGNWKGVGALLVTAQAITSILFLVSLITMNIISGALIALTIAVLIVLFGFIYVKGERLHN